MSTLQPDVIARIEYDYTDEEMGNAVKESLEALTTQALNVGHAQLARAVLFLANGHFETFVEIRKCFYGDPRDLIGYAKSFLEDQGYGFARPFDEMGPLKKRGWLYERERS